MSNILDKLESDNKLFTLGDFFTKLFHDELLFAIQELKKMKETSMKINLHKQLYLNSQIFKENLKLIANILIESIWKKCTNEDGMQEILRQANFL